MMTSAALGWFIAGVFLTAFIVLWFSVSFQELSAKKKSLDSICEQVELHRKLCMQERGGELDAAAQNILESKLLVYQEIVRDYNVLLRSPMLYIPGLILGFRPAGGRESYHARL